LWRALAACAHSRRACKGPGTIGGRAAVSKSEPVEAIVARIESLLAG